MCVIAFSPKGVDIPTQTQLKNMWEHNPDGAGYAYVNKKGKVVYRKGFMKFDDLLKELEAPERFKNTNFAIHFRIGTSGENDRATCHPFPISNCFGDLRKTEGETDAVLFHNGVLSDGGIVSPLASDTQDFVVAMTPLLQKYNRSKARDYFIGELTKGSRLLVLYKNNTFKMYGDWKQDGDIWVSNTHYKTSYSWYGGGYYGYYDYDDYYYGYSGHGSGYGTYHVKDKTTEVKVNNEKINTEEANALWQEIINKEYKFVTEEELQLLKDSADEYTHSTLEACGYKLGYDWGQMVVWLEETPITLDENQLELDIKEEE